MTVRISITDAPVFAGIKKKERQLVDSLATEVDMDAGSTIFEQGGRAKEFGVILEGVVSVMHDGEKIATLGPGDFFGEMALLGVSSEDHRRTATVTAETNVALEVMSVQEFSAALDKLPGVAAAIGRVAAERAAENA